MADITSQLSGGTGPDLSSRGVPDHKSRVGFALNLTKINGGGEYHQNYRHFSKDHVLSSPILSQQPGSQSIQGNEQRKLFLSPRMTEKPSLTAGLQMIQQHHSTVRTARDNALSTANQSAIGRIKTNNYIQKNQQLQQQQQLSPSGGSLTRAGTAATTSSQQVQLGINFPAINGQNMKNFSGALNQSITFRDPLQLQIQALRFQHQMTMATVAGSSSSTINDDLQSNNSTLSPPLNLEAKGSTPRLHIAAINSSTNPSSSLKESQTTTINNTPLVQLNGEDLTPNFNNQQQVQKFLETQTFNTLQLQTQNSSQPGTTQNSIGQDSIINVIIPRPMGAPPGYFGAPVPVGRKKKGGKTRNNKSTFSPNNAEGGSQDTFPLPTQYTNTTLTTMAQTPLPGNSQWQINSTDISKSLLRNGGESGNKTSHNISTFSYLNKQSPRAGILPRGLINISPMKLKSQGNLQQIPSNLLNLDDITPEIAAYVVRSYLLPLFEKDLKRSQKQKRHNEYGTQQSNAGVDGNTVYAELKLSEQLQLEIYSLRDERDDLKEQVECLTLKNTDLEKRIADLNQTLRSSTIKLQQSTQKLSQCTQENQRLTQKLLQTENHSEEALNLATVSELYRQQFASTLQNEKVKNEKADNKLIELRYQLQLKNMESDIMGDQLKSLFDAINNLGDGKKQADKKQFELDELKLQMESIHKDRGDQFDDFKKVTHERDRHRVELKEIARIMKKNNEDKERLLANMKDKIQNTEEELKYWTAEFNKLQEEFQKSEKLVKSLQNERDKMRQRIQKLKNRRNFNINQKICKLCGKEYLEKENFNWSCRTHRSEFGGEMWWCCGKTSKDAAGCKYSKHFSKEDEDEDGIEGEGTGTNDGESQAQKNKNIRCFCCKEKGHNAQECPRDPNFKTLNDLPQEEKRIAKAKDFKKLLSDSLATTSKFFKGLIKRQPGLNDFNPFSKGAMSFDDYSYKYYNEVVLNQKVLKALNEDDEEFDKIEYLKQKQTPGGASGRHGAQGNRENADESQLTAEHMKEFENENQEENITPAASLGGFIPLEIQRRLQQEATSQDSRDQFNNSPNSLNEPAHSGQGGVHMNLANVQTGPTGPLSKGEQSIKRKQTVISDNEGSQEDEDEASDERAKLDIKPKITDDEIERMKMEQDRDLFEDIFEIKQEVRISALTNRHANLIDLKEYAKELYMNAFIKSRLTSRVQRLNQAKSAGAGASNDGQSEWVQNQGGEWIDRQSKVSSKDKQIKNGLVSRNDSSQFIHDVMIDHHSQSQLKPIQEVTEPKSSMLKGTKLNPSSQTSDDEGSSISRQGDGTNDAGFESSQRPLVKGNKLLTKTGSFSSAAELNLQRRVSENPNKKSKMIGNKQLLDEWKSNEGGEQSEFQVKQPYLPLGNNRQNGPQVTTSQLDNTIKKPINKVAPVNDPQQLQVPPMPETRTKKGKQVTAESADLGLQSENKKSSTQSKGGNQDGTIGGSKILPNQQPNIGTSGQAGVASKTVPSQEGTDKKKGQQQKNKK